MELSDAITQRRSIRGFLDTPISKTILQNILSTATRAPSGVNSQPWEIIAVTGEPLKKIKQYNSDCFERGIPPDREDTNVPAGIFRDRSQAIGKALLGAMKIAREDTKNRRWWAGRGYRFFDAPTVLFLLMDKTLNETAYRFDMGCFAQTICLSALDYRLGTCIADQAISYQRGLRDILSIPDSKTIVCGIAIGFPDLDFPANHVKSERKPMDQTVSWCGFVDSPN